MPKTRIYYSTQSILFYTIPIKTYYSVLGYIILIYTRMPLPAHFSPSIFHLISSVFHLLSLIFPSLPSVLPFSLNYLNIQTPFFSLLFILSFLAFGVWRFTFFLFLFLFPFSFPFFGTLSGYALSNLFNSVSRVYLVSVCFRYVFSVSISPPSVVLHHDYYYYLITY